MIIICLFTISVFYLYFIYEKRHNRIYMWMVRLKNSENNSIVDHKFILFEDAKSFASEMAIAIYYENSIDVNFEAVNNIDNLSKNNLFITECFSYGYVTQIILYKRY